MENEEKVQAPPNTIWAIDFDWYQKNNRSLVTLARNYLCARCKEHLSKKKKRETVDDLLSSIKDCCSKEPDFINAQLPIKESVFRFFLANGNQPLDIEELGRQLGERRGGDTYRTSPEILTRLLKTDRYYGLREVKD